MTLLVELAYKYDVADLTSIDTMVVAAGWRLATALHGYHDMQDSSTVRSRKAIWHNTKVRSTHAVCCGTCHAQNYILVLGNEQSCRFIGLSGPDNSCSKQCAHHAWRSANSQKASEPITPKHWRSDNNMHCLCKVSDNAHGMLKADIQIVSLNLQTQINTALKRLTWMTQCCHQ